MVNVGPAIMVNLSPERFMRPIDGSFLHENIDPFYYKLFSRKPVISLSFIQLILACLAMFAQIIGMSYPYVYGFYAYGSSGIWYGILFGTSGSFGIWAGFHPSRCTIIAHMVFAIISACFCIPLTIGSIMSAIFVSDKTNYYRTEEYVTLGMLSSKILSLLNHGLL